MRVKVLGIPGKPILATNLRELAGPVGQHKRAALVRERSVKGTICAIRSPAHKPAAGKLVIRGCIEPESALKACPYKSWTGKGYTGGEIGLILLPPNELTASHKGVIDRTLQWLPAECRVHSVEMRDEVCAKQVVAA